MKAIICSQYGSPEVLSLQELPKPVPGPNQILIKIKATSVTRGDTNVRSMTTPAGFGLMARLALGWNKPKQKILGQEVSGVVEAVGSAVQSFVPGDEVFAFTGAKFGGYAEYICVAEHTAIALKPKNLSHEEAVTLSFGGLTALYFLRAAKIQKDSKILIYGASGAVGTAAIQLAHYFGAHINAVCSAANMQLVKSLKADHVIDYTREDFTHNGQVYDIIFDTVGKLSFSKVQPSLTAKGVFLSALASVPQFLQMLWTSIKGGKKLLAGVATEKKEDLFFLKELAESGDLKSVIDRTYPLADVVEAHRYVDMGHKKGNVVIVVSE